MTPKLTKAIHAVEKLPQARQDALADLLLDAAARAQVEAALVEGEESGPAAPFDFDAFLAARRPDPA